MIGESKLNLCGKGLIIFNLIRAGVRAQDKIKLWWEDFSFTQLIEKFTDVFYQEELRWFLLVPIFFGLGIYSYFSINFEPSFAFTLILVLMAIVLVAIIGIGFGFDSMLILIAFAFLIFSLGFARTQWRAHSVAAPMIKEKTQSMVEAVIIEIDATRPQKTQDWIILPTHIENFAKIPKYIRIRVKSFKGRNVFRTGDNIKLKAVLFPPPQRTLPNGYDFARHFWFKQLGATGISIDPPELTKGRTQNFNSWLDNLRNSIAKRIDKTLHNASAAGIAAALIVGKRGFILKATDKKLRNTGLAHILAISGLHMAALAGTVYFFVRAILALISSLALTYPIKKWAIIPALFAAVIYLFLSGGSISTQRAFVMFVIAGLAILMGARVLTQRNVAIAALTILTLTPESLLQAGFQLSFAATIGIVALYENVSLRLFNRSANNGRLELLKRRMILGATTLILTSLVAWLATTPFAVFHFNRIGFVPAIIANISVLPIFTLWVMPSVVLALPLMLFALEKPIMIFLGWGIEIISAIINYIIKNIGEAQLVLAPPDYILTLYVIGGLWLCVWQTNWRYLGAFLLVVTASLSLFTKQEQADLIISQNVFAIRGSDKLLYPSRPSNWKVSQWLRADGDDRSVWQAYDKNKFNCNKSGCIAKVDKLKIVFLYTNKCFKKFKGADIFIGEDKKGDCKGKKLNITTKELKQKGPHLIYLKPSLRVKTAPLKRKLWSNIHETSQPNALEP